MDVQQMLELLLGNQEKAKADQARMEAKMDANQAKEAKQEEMLAEMKADREQKNPPTKDLFPLPSSFPSGT
jgi:hypothetical protein